jgi:hypothetical protein
MEREKDTDLQTVEREHARRVKVAERIVRRLPQDDQHERRKAGELVAHAWDALPSVNARRTAVVAAGRAFLHALAAYTPDVVYAADRDCIDRLAPIAACVAPIIEELDRAARRPDAGLRIFRGDSVKPRGAFRSEAAAEKVAAACGVLRVGPGRRPA